MHGIARATPRLRCGSNLSNPCPRPGVSRMISWPFSRGFSTKSTHVLPDVQHHPREGLVGSSGATDLTLAHAVAVQPQRRTERLAGYAALGAGCGADLVDAWRPLLPELALDRALDHTLPASVVRHCQSEQDEEGGPAKNASSSPVLWPACCRCSVFRAPPLRPSLPLGPILVRNGHPASSGRCPLELRER